MRNGTAALQCPHLYYNMIDGKLSCSECGQPPPPKVKAVDQETTHNKAVSIPPESKRMTKHPRARKRGR